MRDDKKTIKILYQIVHKEYVLYQLQIQENGQTFSYYSRYSELHKLFSQLPMQSCPFPSKHSITTFFAPYIGKETAQRMQNQRFAELKKYFQELVIEGEEGKEIFQELMAKAQSWEKKVLESKPMKGKSLKNIESSCGVKFPYILA